MWIRFEATTRRPASSSSLVTAPVRLRRVASGLMIEKVRVTAIVRAPGLSGVGIGRAPSRTAAFGQGSGPFRPPSVLKRPIISLDPFATGEKLPRQPCAFQRLFVEQVKGAVIA